MKRLVVIAEGDAEKGFVYDILRPYFYSIGFMNDIQCFKIKNSHGGLSKYSDVKRDIINTIYENDVIVSTMFDYYRLPSSFPNTKDALTINTHLGQVEYLEEKMRQDIEQTQGELFKNLIPYIQLHEFEALVFSSIRGVDELFESSEFNRESFVQLLSDFPNPEDINNKPDTAPSVQIKKIIPGYNKYTDGIPILQRHGMDTLLEKCPHFRDWVTRLKNALQF